MKSISFNHSKIKLEINKQKKNLENSQIWGNETPDSLNNQTAHRRNQREIRKYLETNENENRAY